MDLDFDDDFELDFEDLLLLLLLLPLLLELLLDLLVELDLLLWLFVEVTPSDGKGAGTTLCGENIGFDRLKISSFILFLSMREGALAESGNSDAIQ